MNEQSREEEDFFQAPFLKKILCDLDCGPYAKGEWRRRFMKRTSS